MVLGCISVGMILAGHVPEAHGQAARLGADDVQRAVLVRWIARTRWARGVGGVCGITLWFAGRGTRGGDLLLLGVGGLAIGTMLAELHNVRRRAGPATASLEVRSVRRYLDRTSRRGMLAAGAVAGAVTVATCTQRGGGRSALVWAGAALLSLGIVVIVQRRVAVRPRPAINVGLLEVDDLVRSLAVSQGLARPGTALSLAFSARALSVTAGGNGWVGAGLGAKVVWIAAAVIWWRNRHLGLDAAPAIGDRGSP